MLNTAHIIVIIAASAAAKISSESSVVLVNDLNLNLTIYKVIYKCSVDAGENNLHPAAEPRTGVADG